MKTLIHTGPDRNFEADMRMAAQDFSDQTPHWTELLRRDSAECAERITVLQELVRTKGKCPQFSFYLAAITRAVANKYYYTNAPVLADSRLLEINPVDEQKFNSDIELDKDTVVNFYYPNTPASKNLSDKPFYFGFIHSYYKAFPRPIMGPYGRKGLSYHSQFAALEPQHLPRLLDKITRIYRSCVFMHPSDIQAIIASGQEEAFLSALNSIVSLTHHDFVGHGVTNNEALIEDLKSENLKSRWRAANVFINTRRHRGEHCLQEEAALIDLNAHMFSALQKKKGGTFIRQYKRAVTDFVGVINRVKKSGAEGAQKTAGAMQEILKYLLGNYLNPAALEEVEYSQWPSLVERPDCVWQTRLDIRHKGQRISSPDYVGLIYGGFSEDLYDLSLFERVQVDFLVDYAQQFQTEPVQLAL
jgi:hypothetical protein